MIWKPNKVERDTIKQYAADAAKIPAYRMSLDIGIRIANDGRLNRNILFVDETEHWEKSDLWGFQSWSEFWREGVTLCGGCAVVDIYVYDKHEGLMTNIQLYVGGHEMPRLLRLEQTDGPSLEIGGQIS